VKQLVSLELLFKLQTWKSITIQLHQFQEQLIKVYNERKAFLLQQNAITKNTKARYVASHSLIS
jgi:hypothetical protein